MLALALAHSACATDGAHTRRSHAQHSAATERFDGPCADEEPYRVKAYAELAAHAGRARAVVAVTAGYRATGGRTVFIETRLERLKLSAGESWGSAPYTLTLVATHAGRTARSETATTYTGGPIGQEPGRYRFAADARGRSDWIRLLERTERPEGDPLVYHVAPDLSITAHALGVRGANASVGLALEATNATTGETLVLNGAKIRIPERIWTLVPPTPKTLGLGEALNPAEEGGVFAWLGRAWKYRDCPEARRAAKAALGPFERAPGG